MKSLRRYAPLLGLLVFGALIWLGIYAYQEGFTKKWRKLIVKEFAKHDLNISFDTLTIDPFQGLVANKVVLLEGDTKQEIARVSQARLDVDLAKLIQSKRFLQRIELDSANVYLPYDRKDPNSQRVEFKNLQATVILPDGEIEIVNAEADFYGLRLNLTGDLQRPKEGSGETVSWETEKVLTARPFLENLVEHLAPLRSQQGREPVLNMAVSGDLAKPETLAIKAQLVGKNIQYGELELTDVSVQAAITDQLFSLSKLTISDAQDGRFDLIGDVPLKGKREATLSLSSSIDFGKLLPSMDPTIGLGVSLILHNSPIISLHGTLDLDQPFKWSAPPANFIGHVTAEDFQVGDESFKLLQADFHLDGARFLAKDIRIDHQYGNSIGKIMRTPTEGIRYEFSLGMDPTLLQQLPLPEAATTFLKRWEFRPNSGVEMKLSGERKAQDNASWEHKGNATLTECRFETAELEKLQFNFILNPHVYHFSKVEAQLKSDTERHYSGGTVRAERLSVNARDSLSVLTGVHGKVDPGQVVRCFSKDTAESLDAYRFSQAPEIQISQGTIDPQNGAQTNLEVEVKSSGILKTTLFEEDISLAQPRFGLRFLKDSLLVRLDHAGLFGGHLAGNADIRNLDDSRNYTAKIKLTELQFKELASIYFSDDKADGQLTGNFAWRGRGPDLAAVAGTGEVHLMDIKLLEVPLLGPVSKLLDRVGGETKLSHGVIRDLGGQFSLQSSNLSLEPFVADLGNYTIKGNGTVELPTSAVDMTVSLSNHSDSGNALNVLYGIFGTYQCTGTLEKPRWTMVNQIDSTKVNQSVIDTLGAPDRKVQIDPDQIKGLDPKALLKDVLKKQRSKVEEQR
jgi:hypothetical protein